MRKDMNYADIIKYLVFIGDALLIFIVFKLSELIASHGSAVYQWDSAYYAIFGLTWVVAGFYNRIYHINQFWSTKNILLNISGTFVLHLLILILVLSTLSSPVVNFSYLVVSYSILVILIVWSRLVFKLTFKYLEFGGFDIRKVIIVGATPEGIDLYDFFDKHKSSGYEFLGFFDDQSHPDISDDLLKGSIAEVMNFCLENDVDEIYCALPMEKKDIIQELKSFSDHHVIYFRLAPNFSNYISENYNLLLYDQQPIITLRKEPLGATLNRIIKRTFDIVFSLLVILFLFPIIFPIIAIAIKWESPGPVLFKQLRPGRRNRLFECYKFRTMRVNDNTELQATKNDPRVTRVGAFLRKTSLDELPQFFNVLFGNMSVVGPRPNLVSQLERYSKTIEKYEVRHFVTPGITGYAQVNGLRGETKEDGLMEKRVEYDVKYLENWSFLFDLKIIFLTIYNVFKGEKNAY